MPDVQKVSIALTAEQVAQLKQAVQLGEYATTSEAVREALREWQRKRESHTHDLDRLRQLWAEGKRSGSAAKADLDEVKRRAAARLKEESALQVRRAG